MLVRSLSGIGETAAMIVGAPSANSVAAQVRLSSLVKVRR
jgi:hypothetical protein